MLDLIVMEMNKVNCEKGNSQPFSLKTVNNFNSSPPFGLYITFLTIYFSTPPTTSCANNFRRITDEIHNGI